MILDLETLVYHSLNSTASALWELLAEPKPEAALVEALCEQYEVSPEHCSVSVRGLLAQLEASKLVSEKTI
ncbi:PqqD family protein [Granulicella tundricola]|uniref:PqqD family protein n=1 Tax=Granulicella tundricola TaxID=940615 RepID=UPI0002E37587|nr:PqqD family protein [Granulicella tundricola]